MGVTFLGLLLLSLLPGAGEEEGRGILAMGGGGIRLTGGRPVTVTYLYLSPGFDLSFLSRIKLPVPHLILVL